MTANEISIHIVSAVIVPKISCYKCTNSAPHIYEASNNGLQILYSYWQPKKKLLSVINNVRIRGFPVKYMLQQNVYLTNALKLNQIQFWSICRQKELNDGVWHSSLGRARTWNKRVRSFILMRFDKRRCKVFVIFSNYR